MGEHPHKQPGARSDRLTLYATPQHPCSYLSGRRAVTAFVDPYRTLNNRIYSRLADLGFRRSGSYIYRPACPGCDACVPVRIPVEDFRPRRAERRTWRRNR
ncbi:MAG: hypothetical protein GWO02_12040, partial [Gammaproteobacteria bacterium]|nr:hypothetical protein [Gammaproteobacteria bacterium]